MKLNCLGDYKLQEEWLEKHKYADVTLYDIPTCLPRCAIYINPIYQAYVTDVNDFINNIKDCNKYINEHNKPNILNNDGLEY